MSKKKILQLSTLAILVLAALIIAGDLTMFINPGGLLLVIGGTLAGVFLAFPSHTLAGLWNQLSEINKKRNLDQKTLTKIFVHLARMQRTEGVRTLEAQAKRTGNIFLEMGVAMVVDEKPASQIRERLEQEFDFMVSRREGQRAVLSLMGRLAPAFGLAGTMIGLIRMLHTISDPTEVAAGMSVALLTTFYGIMLANLVILPLERKLNEKNRAEAVEMSLITEGIMGLCNEENGAAMDARLNSFKFARTEEEINFSGNWFNQIKGMVPQMRRSGHDS
jgi:chemotaxis protein MotA